jgi:hypothetical protein
MGVGDQCHAQAALHPPPPAPERHSIHCIGGWVGLRDGLDRFGKSRPQRDSIPRPSSLQQETTPTTLFRLPRKIHTYIHTILTYLLPCVKLFKTVMLRKSVLNKNSVFIFFQSFVPHIFALITTYLVSY